LILSKDYELQIDTNTTNEEKNIEEIKKIKKRE